MVVDRKYIHIYESVHNTTMVTSYDGSNSRLNEFLWIFDIWNCNGHWSLCSDDEHAKISFECSKEFYNLAKTEEFVNAFKRLGVKVLFDNDPKVLELD